MLETKGLFRFAVHYSVYSLFGNSDNWQTQAKRFSEYFRVILVDLRNHGHSDWNDDSSYMAMANDVIELIQDLKLEKTILLGHSMGGKVAMQVAQRNANFLSKLVVVDMGIKEYPPHHQHILNGIHSVKLEGVNSRSEAEKQLSTYIDSEGVKQFLLKNLYWKEKGKLAWRMNFHVLERKMSEILKEITFTESWIPTLFIRGELSNYVLDEDLSTLEQYFPDCNLVTIQGAGHWVHAEAQETYLTHVLALCLR